MTPPLFDLHFVLVSFKTCAPRANLMTTQNISDSEIPPAKARRAPSSDNNFLCGLCVFAGDIPNLWLRLCRARIFVSSVVHTSPQETQNSPDLSLLVCFGFRALGLGFWLFWVSCEEIMHDEGPSVVHAQPRLGISPAKTQRPQRNKINFRTWRSWRLGARNIRIR